jgi:xanthine dehydrogenase accessory factor
MSFVAPTDWLVVARENLTAGKPCALVTVAAIRGSAPREAGACMLVMADDVIGTIGGGRLEQQAIDLARELIRDKTTGIHRQTSALGPELGQCCGGSVDLTLEALFHADPATLSRWAALRAAEQPSRPLYLFGAGHVGFAVAGIAASLPYRLTWIDSRPEIAAKAAAANLPLTISAQPALEVDSAAPDGLYLVMTHSHALDLEICERVLKCGDFAFLGLIGSTTKRAKFVKRLRNRGVSEESLSRLVCPIGVPGIHGKLPAVIAVAAMAQVLGISEKNAASGLKIA